MSSYIRRIGSPLTGDHLSPLAPEITDVYIDDVLTDPEYSKVATLIKSRPDVELTIFKFDKEKPSLDALKHFPFLKSLSINDESIVDWLGIGNINRKLESLKVFNFKGKFSLTSLAEFNNLSNLFLHGKFKDLNAINQIASLSTLTTWYVTFPDVKILKEITGLNEISFHHGVNNDISFSAEMPSLHSLGLMRVKKLEVIEPLRFVANLRRLFLVEQPRIAEVPDFRDLQQLEFVMLDGMHGLTDIEGLANAPNLRTLIVNGAKLKLDQFRCLKNHPSLKECYIHSGGWREALKIEEMLNLPAPDGWRRISTQHAEMQAERKDLRARGLL